MSEQMRAIVQCKYGSPDELKLKQIDRPMLTDDRVLVRVRAAGVHAGDWHLVRGKPFLLRLMFGLRQPRHPIPGTDMAGEVVAIGKNVTLVAVGDAVFGDLSASGFGAFGEYVCLPETALAPKPNNLSFIEAAAVPVSALAALQGLRDAGKLQSGQKVLINGATGGVGSFAIQIAKSFGAEVTAMCSGSKADLAIDLGADRLIDYTQTPVAALPQGEYDLIFDAAAYRSPLDYAPALAPSGIYVLVGGSTWRIFQMMLFGSMLSRIAARQMKFLVSEPNRSDLLVLKDLIETGNLRPHIDRTYALSEVPQAIDDLERRQVRGKIAIEI
jgi:NADPH:quinone reductase-like Zn-dependent oxidoreductase